MMLRKSRKISCVVHILLVTFLLSGCASQYGQQITKPKYCPECYQPIQDLRNAEKQFNTTVAGSVVAGALLGAVVGGIATGKPQGALAGAAAGALVGGVAGYALAKQQKIKDDNQRLASYMADLDGDISGLDRVAAAARTARKCYDKQFEQNLAAFKEGRMSRAELDDRYTEIKNGTLEANQILGTLLAGAANKEIQYQEALKSEAQKAQRPIPEPVAAVQVAQPAPEPEPVQAKSTKKHKKHSKHQKAEETPAPAPKPAKPDVAQAAHKTPVVETGDKLTDMSSRKARLTESINDLKEEKQQLDKAQAERQKTLDQLLG